MRAPCLFDGRETDRGLNRICLFDGGHEPYPFPPLSSSLRVQFNRSELLTEVVKDVDIMPADPYENLPLNIPLMPPSLNGRPRPALGVSRRRVLVSQLLGWGGWTQCSSTNLRV